MRVMRALGALLLLLAIGVTALYFATEASGPAWGTVSADRLRPGPYEVGRAERTLVDGARPTPANGEFAGAPSRTLETTLWFPAGAGGAHPLVVYSHGFMSMRDEAERYAAHLASYGSVVIAADYPLTNFRAPGGPTLADAVNQPADVAFLIETATHWDSAERPFAGEIDLARIGAAGLSLGGFTTTLAAFHPTLRDPRIAAAVSIAGPSAMFAPSFFANARVPFLMIAGEADAMVDYAANAAPIREKLAHGGALLTLAGGSHAGFAPFSDGLMRILGNPDRLGCWALTRRLGAARDENPFAALGGEAQGVIALPRARPCANGAAARALAPGRQQMISELALRAFFESVWAPDEAARAGAARFLAETLAQNFPEASYQAVAPLPPAREVELPATPDYPSAPDAEPIAPSEDEPRRPLRIDAPAPDYLPHLPVLGPSSER
jgi:dienelactone hydrolase